MKDATQDAMKSLDKGDNVHLKYSSKYSDSIVEKEVTVIDPDSIWVRFSDDKEQGKLYRVCSSSGSVKSMNNSGGQMTETTVGRLKQVEEGCPSNDI